MNTNILAVIQLMEEKTLFGTLRIQFLNFGHEHVSSAPGEPFSATVGVYRFKIIDGNQEQTETFFTNATGASNPIRFFDRYEIKLVSASPDQKTIKVNLIKLH